MSKKCPKRPFEASWQPPRKMSKKCLENVLVLGLALEKCPKMTKKNVPQTFSRHFFDIFLGGCQEAPKGLLGHFFDIFQLFPVLALLRVNNITSLERTKPARKRPKSARK